MQSRTSVIKKSVILSAVIVLFVFGCGGSVNLLTWKTQIERLISPQQLIQPEKVAEFYAEMEPHTGTDPTKIYEFISSEIQYTSDLFNYAAMNHLATAEEVLLSKKDDCDGQAVLLCSVLRYQGYDAYVVIGPSHAWVEVEPDTLINYRGGDWFVRFNESAVEWKWTTLLLWILEEFLLLTVVFSFVGYAYEKKALVYLQEALGYLKYVLLFFLGYILIGILVLVVKSTLWIFWLVVVLVSILLVVKVVTKVRTYLART